MRHSRKITTGQGRAGSRQGSGQGLHADPARDGFGKPPKGVPNPRHGSARGVLRFTHDSRTGLGRRLGVVRGGRGGGMSGHLGPMHAAPAVVIDQISGVCPVQAYGRVDGEGFSFRARHAQWSFEVQGDQPDDEPPMWACYHRYRGEAPTAGHITHDEARAFILQGAREYAAWLDEREDGDAPAAAPESQA